MVDFQWKYANLEAQRGWSSFHRVHDRCNSFQKVWQLWCSPALLSHTTLPNYKVVSKYTKVTFEVPMTSISNAIFTVYFKFTFFSLEKLIILKRRLVRHFREMITADSQPIKSNNLKFWYKSLNHVFKRLHNLKKRNGETNLCPPCPCRRVRRNCYSSSPNFICWCHLEQQQRHRLH